MFYTHPTAERVLPSGMAPVGERSWSWVELCLQIPYFLVSFTVEIDGGALGRHFLFSQLKDVVGLITTSGDKIKDLKISLLSPGYMNSGNSYQLGQVKEIWKRRGGREELFVMSDGKKLHFLPDEGSVKEQEMVLVVSL